MQDVLLKWTEVENYTSCNDSFTKYEVDYNGRTYQLDVDAAWEPEQDGPPFVAGQSMHFSVFSSKYLLRLMKRQRYLVY